jgi:ribosomal protein S18 acetylase RimI-like enzyme
VKTPGWKSTARSGPAADVLRGLRALRPGDETLLQEFFRSHTFDTIYERYGGLVATMTPARAHELVSVDQSRDCALAIVSPDGGKIQAVGRYCLDPKGDAAELAFVVREDQRRQGLATLLLQRLTAIARARGLRRLWAQVGSHNAAMLSLFRRHGFSLVTEREAPLVHATLALS